MLEAPCDGKGLSHGLNVGGAKDIPRAKICQHETLYRVIEYSIVGHHSYSYQHVHVRTAFKNRPCYVCIEYPDISTRTWVHIEPPLLVEC